MTKNYNIRFREGKAEERQAWECLHSDAVRGSFKSRNSFVVAAINDFYERHLCIKKDPYLESREKEDAFADRIVRRVEEKFLDNLPGIIGQFFISRSVLNEKREMVNVDSGSCGTGKDGVNHGK